MEHALTALAVPDAQAPEEEKPERECTTVECVIAQSRRELGNAEPRVERFESNGLVVAELHYELSEEDDDRSGVEVVDEVVLADGRRAFVLEPGLEYQRYYSWFDDHGFVSEPHFVTGPPELGRLVLIVIGTYGRNDEGEGSESTLWICAERPNWSCADVQIGSSQSRDCEAAGTCTSEEDEAEEPTRTGFALDYRIDGADLVLEPTNETFETPVEPPRSGRVPADLARNPE